MNLYFYELSFEYLHIIKLSFSTYAFAETDINLQVISPGDYYYDKIKYSSNRAEDDYYFKLVDYL